MRIKASKLRLFIRESLLAEISDEALSIPPKERYKNLMSTSTGSTGAGQPIDWNEVIDLLLPGTPVADGYDIIKKFSDVIEKRLQYNKQNNLPPETKTQEEIAYREKLLKSTPFFGYPNSFEFLNLCIRKSHFFFKLI